MICKRVSLAALICLLGGLAWRNAGFGKQFGNNRRKSVPHSRIDRRTLYAPRVASSKDEGPCAVGCHKALIRLSHL
jgi:hypothetical protein